MKQSNKVEEILSIMTFTLISGFVASLIFAFGPWDLLGEVCSKKFIPSDINGLKVDLEKNVFGQHIAKEYVLSLLEHHVTSPPTKALALYFYGPTGTGKNLVTSYIAKNMFKYGTKSRYYHYFNGYTDFGHAEKKDEYREELKAYVQKATRYCENNIFVFDEIHKIVPGVLDALVPYIDATRYMYGLDFRKNIFIFLSNSGGEDLISLTSKHLEDGKNREDITYEDTLPLIKEGTLFEKDGLKDSILKNLIKLHIPFLPLEKEHVKKCIKAELKVKKWLATDDVLNNIANELKYVPPEKEMFSEIGCRKVKTKMELYVDDFLKKQTQFQNLYRNSKRQGMKEKSEERRYCSKTGGVNLDVLDPENKSPMADFQIDTLSTSRAVVPSRFQTPSTSRLVPYNHKSKVREYTSVKTDELVHEFMNWIIVEEELHSLKKEKLELETDILSLQRERLNLEIQFLKEKHNLDIQHAKEKHAAEMKQI